MRQADLKLIRQLPLFSEMTQTHFAVLVQAALLQRFPEHVLLIQEGERPDFLHVLIEGAVELFARSETRETVIDVINPVTTFILAAVIRDDVYLKSARTLTPSRVLLLPAEVVRETFGRDAAFARAIVNELADRYRRNVRLLKDHKLRTGIERLANWILDEDARQGTSGRIKLPHDKRTLSLRLGMTPENLSRNFASLHDHGVSGQGRDILINDRESLQALARPNHLING